MSMDIKILLLVACLVSCTVLEVYGAKGGNGNGLPKACKLPKEIGRCKAALTRYYYDVETMQCEEFIYGGCGGNLNNFETIEACQKKCVK